MLPLLGQTLQCNPAGEHIVIGDFNLHHPHWTEFDNHSVEKEAEVLVAIAETNQLQLLLPPGTPIRQERGQHTTIDLAFATPLIAESLIACGLADQELDHDSDHLPISTTIGIATFTYDRPNKRIWHQLDEKLLHETMTQTLPAPWVPADT
jgi:endonuclease/exonuclease/phosphatase family metal-dependent hydrolase